MEIVRQSLRHLGRTAVAANAESFTYAGILAASLGLCARLQAAPPPPPASTATHPFSQQPRVAVACSPGPEYVAATWATWLHRGIAVPLCLDHPDREVGYVLEDAGVSAVLATPQHVDRMRQLATPLAAQVLSVPPITGIHSGQHSDLTFQAGTLLDDLHPSDAALIVYTSGTTGRPKGAVHTHSSVTAMVDTLVQAWEWREEDRILHALPLHHVHGIVNALYCALAVGAAVEFVPKFSPHAVWQAFMRQEPKADVISVFMGVPTMYAFLLNYLESGMAEDERQQAQRAARRLRLTVSGSAACPVPIMDRWKDVSGRIPLERYGMTETGMIVGNPLRGERRPGSVGLPFPGVDIIIQPPSGDDASAAASSGADTPSTNGNTPGELLVKSAQLFAGYWGRADATAEAFNTAGYFKTGDTAVWEGDPPYIRLLGRTSVDIIKRGGYKISALGIESALARHPAIAECAVLGVPDGEWGEAVAAVVALKPGHTGLTVGEMAEWAGGELPKYQVPTVVKVVDRIPRNAMGKINKKGLRKELFGG